MEPTPAASPSSDAPSRRRLHPLPGAAPRRTLRRTLALACCLGWAFLTPLPPAAGAGSPLVNGPLSARSEVAPWRLPADGRVATLFAAPPARWGPGHRGIDITAAVGSTVRAPQRGVVLFVGTVVDRGVVTLRHDGGLRSSLEPVTASVAVGDTVEAGAGIGVVSAEPAHCPGCLHWGVRAGTDYLDPLSLFDREPVVLLPAALSPDPPPGGTCAAGAWPPCASARSGTR